MLSLARIKVPPFLDIFYPSKNLNFHILKVNLGVIFKGENLGEEMIDIIRGLHGLVPTVECLGGQEKFDRVPVAGDQKTMEREVEAPFSVRNAYTKSRRLEGLFFQLADWHHENKFLAVSRGCMWCFNFDFNISE